MSESYQFYSSMPNDPWYVTLWKALRALMQYNPTPVDPVIARLTQFHCNPLLKDEFVPVSSAYQYESRTPDHLSVRLSMAQFDLRREPTTYQD